MNVVDVPAALHCSPALGNRLRAKKKIKKKLRALLSCFLLAAAAVYFADA